MEIKIEWPHNLTIDQKETSECNEKLSVDFPILSKRFFFLARCSNLYSTKACKTGDIIWHL